MEQLSGRYGPNNIFYQRPQQTQVVERKQVNIFVEISCHMPAFRAHLTTVDEFATSEILASLF
jgi:hypothetical protein